MYYNNVDSRRLLFIRFYFSAAAAAPSSAMCIIIIRSPESPPPQDLIVVVVVTTTILRKIKTRSPIGSYDDGFRLPTCKLYSKQKYKSKPAAHVRTVINKQNEQLPRIGGNYARAISHVFPADGRVITINGSKKFF